MNHQVEKANTPAVDKRHDPAGESRTSLDALRHEYARRFSNLLDDLAEVSAEVQASATRCAGTAEAAMAEARGRAFELLSDSGESPHESIGADAEAIVGAAHTLATKVGAETERLARSVSHLFDEGGQPTVDIFDDAAATIVSLVEDFKDQLDAEAEAANARARAALDRGPVIESTDSVADQQTAQLHQQAFDQARLRAVNDPSRRVPVTLSEFPDPSAEPGLLEHAASFVDGAVRGDFSDDPSTAATIGRMIGGQIPAADARDVVAGAVHLAEGRPGAAVELAAAAAGFIPLVREASQLVGRGVRTTVDEGIERIARKGFDTARPGGGRWLGRVHGLEVPSVQAGHATSRHSGAVERLALEDADANQMTNWTGESNGVVFEKQPIEIAGAIIDRATALRHATVLEALAKESGRESRLTVKMVEEARLHPGWVPDKPVKDIKQAFMRRQLKIIKKDREHPLRYLIDADDAFR